jgi:hypothetical protein
MYDDMTIDDAANVVRVFGDERADDTDRDVRALASAAKRLLQHIDELAFELEREQARRHGLKPGDARRPDGHLLLEGMDGGGRRDFLGDRPVHAGEALFLLTSAGWHPVRYESNVAGREPVLYVALPGVRKDVAIGVPRDARLAWPEEVR